MSLLARLQLAVDHHRAGRLELAEELYASVIDESPQCFDAWKLLGVLNFQRGNVPRGLEYLERAVELSRRTDPTSLANLAEGYRLQGRLIEARNLLLEALQLDDRAADAWNNLGMVHKALGELASAEGAHRRAISLRPEHALAWNNLGNVLSHLGRHDEAIAALDRAAQDPQIRPDALYNLGRSLHAAGRNDEAIRCFAEVVTLSPQHAGSWALLGMLRLLQGDHPAAETALQTAVRLQPQLLEAWSNLGVLYTRLGRISAARHCYESSLALNANNAETHANLGHLLQAIGDAAAAREQFEIALRLRPGFVQAENNRLMGMLYDPRVSPAELAQEHLAWGKRFVRGWRQFTDWPQSRDPERRIRVGFVSSDLGQHPVGYILLPLVEHLDREQFEVTCYSNRRCHDVVEQRLIAASARWRFVVGVPDVELAQMIRRDEIDVLFDLSGHTAQNWLGTFAMRPAPVQIAWGGYPATTGLPTIDWLLSDPQMLPPDTDAGLFSERIVRLPEAAWCCGIVGPERDVPWAETRRTGPLTLGSFNNPAKFSPPVIRLWSRILLAVPDARLLLKFRGLDDPLVSERFRQLFVAEGVDPARLEFRGMSPFEQMLAEYREVDVALDPFPFTGGITTLIALWMGVPVVTLAGSTIAARQSTSMLTAAGVIDTIATTDEQYVNLVVELNQDRVRLDELRQRLRPAVEQSAFLSAARFVPGWSTAVRQIWQRWCRGE